MRPPRRQPERHCRHEFVPCPRPGAARAPHAHRIPARGAADQNPLRAGHSYEAIARQERLSRERIRQIVAMSLETEKGATLPDPNRVQIARLEPALRLAASGVENGDFRAIPQLLRVLERIDKYGAVVKAEVESSAEIHARLMKKMTSAFERHDREKAEKAAREAKIEASAPSPEPAGTGMEEAKTLEKRESGFLSS